ALHQAQKGEFDRMPALRVVERGVVLRREHPAHARGRETRELAEMPGTRRIEVHATRDVVRTALFEERVDHRAHRGHLARRVWHHVWPAPTQTTHVGEERALLTTSKIATAHDIASRALEVRLVDVGTVLTVTNCLANSRDY